MSAASSMRLLESPLEVQRYWPELEQRLQAEPELWSDSFSVDSLLTRALTGRLQIWIVERAQKVDLMLMTQVYSTDVRGILQVFWAHGEDLKERLPLLLSTAEDFAATQGCDKIEVQCRKGFVRLLAPFGWKMNFVTVEKAVRPTTRN